MKSLLLFVLLFIVPCSLSSQSVSGNLRNPVVEKLDDGFLVYGVSKSEGEKRLNVYKFNFKLEKVAEYTQKIKKIEYPAAYYSAEGYHFFYFYTYTVILNKDLSVVNDKSTAGSYYMHNLFSDIEDGYLRVVRRTEKISFYKDKMYVLKEKGEDVGRDIEVGRFKHKVNRIDICESNINEAFNKYTIVKSIELPYTVVFNSDFFLFGEDRAYVFVNDMIKSLKNVAQHILCFDIKTGKIIYTLKLNAADNKDAFSISNAMQDENGDLIIIGNYFNDSENIYEEAENARNGISDCGYFFKRINSEGKVLTEKKYVRKMEENYGALYIQKLKKINPSTYLAVGEAISKYEVPPLNGKCKNLLTMQGEGRPRQSKFFFVFTFDQEFNILSTKKIDIPQPEACSNIVFGLSDKIFNFIPCSQTKIFGISPYGTVTSRGYSFEELLIAGNGEPSLLFNSSMADDKAYKGFDKQYYLYKDGKMQILKSESSKEDGTIFALDDNKICKFTFSGSDDSFKLEIVNIE